MQKAIRLLGPIENVTAQTRLLAPADLEKILSSLEDSLVTCDQSQAATLVAHLISAYPERSDMKKEKDFPVYALRLAEAFMVFPYDVGLLAVNGGSGVPSLKVYKPKPADIVSFCKAEVDRRINAKSMAIRQQKEHARRIRAKAEDERINATSTPVRRQELSEMWLNRKAEMLKDERFKGGW